MPEPDRKDNLAHIGEALRGGRELETVGEKVRSGRLTNAQRRNRVLGLYASGMTEEEIAEVMQTTQQAVSKIITRQLRKWASENEKNLGDVRTMKLFELDQLKKSIWGQALTGNMKAQEAARRIIELQIKVHGLDQHHDEDHLAQPAAHVDEEEVARMEEAWVHAEQPKPRFIDVEGEEISDG